MTTEINKIFFNPGDVVTIRHEIENKPTMVVREKIVRSIVNKYGEKEAIFVGIKCFWFDENKDLQEGTFSTKDLIHIQNE